MVLRGSTQSRPGRPLFKRPSLPGVTATCGLLMAMIPLVATAAQAQTTISPVGTLASASGDSLTVSPQTVGDLMVLTVSTDNSTPPTVTSVTGGGVSDWSLAQRFDDTTNALLNAEIWYGTISTTGSSTITATISGFSNFTDLTAQEFSAGGAATWSVDTGGGCSTLGTPWSYPSLTAAGSGELYYGVAIRNNSGTLSGNGTTGFTYEGSSFGNGDLVAYDADASGTIQPTGINSAGGSYEDTVAALFTTGSGGGSSGGCGSGNSNGGGNGNGGGTGSGPCTTTSPSGGCGPYQDADITNSNGYDSYVVNNMWAALPGTTQTLTANSMSDWNVVANAGPAGYTGVQTYPDDQQLMNNWCGNGWNGCPTSTNTPLSGLASLTSSFTESMPHNAETQAEAGYDIWIGNAPSGVSDEVMIWVDNVNRGSGGATQIGTATIAGQHFTVYQYGGAGGEIIFSLNSNESSGTVDILDTLDWLVQAGYEQADAQISQIDFGWEICTTGAQDETFSISSYSLTGVAGTPAATLPSAPSGTQASAGDGQATVSFSPPASDGGAPITSYTVTAADSTNPANGGQTATGTTSPITVSGLTNGDSYTFTVTATNSVGSGGVSAPTNAVTPTAPLAIGTTSLPAATLGSPYSNAVTATGGSLPYRFSLSSGSLPLGLSLNTTTGTITGTPVLPGISQVTVTVSDASGETASQALSLDVAGCTRITGTRSGPLSLEKGVTCLTNATLHGNLSIGLGATVVVSGSRLDGGVTAQGTGTFSMCGSTVNGPLSIRAATGFVLVGAAGAQSCGANTIAGPVELSGNGAGVELGANTIAAAVTVSNNAGATSGLGAAGTRIYGNQIAGPLSCSGNVPAPTDDSQPNTVGGPATGQCTGLAVTDT